MYFWVKFNNKNLVTIAYGRNKSNDTQKEVHYYL